MSEQRKAVIKNADMSEDMQQDAVDCASQALSKYNIEKVREGILTGLLFIDQPEPGSVSKMGKKEREVGTKRLNKDG